MREVSYAIVIAAASYRLWAFIALDTITLGARRAFLFKRLSDDNKVDREPRSRIVLYFVMCPWCLGSWITAAVTLIADVTIANGLPAPVLIGVAAATGTALLGGNDDRLMASDGDLY